MNFNSQQIYKYPRTHHIEGSCLQSGDEDLNIIPFSKVADKYLVVEEKMDGANSGISFTENGKLLLQSRGHYLTGGEREKHFNLFKSWAAAHSMALFEVLGSRYIMYGEWLYAKHTVYYNKLPHYFMEFDILDTYSNSFLSTAAREEILNLLPFVISVKVLYEGKIDNIEGLRSLLTPSYFIGGDHLHELYKRASEKGIDPERVLKETDPTNYMEGLYVKVEQEGQVTDRFKYVRKNFLNTVLQARDHWLNRPIIPNKLQEGVELFGGFYD